MDINLGNEKVTGAPGVIELGGVTYLVGQPDDRTFTTLLARIRENRKNMPRPLQAIAADLQCLAPEDRAAAIKVAVELQSDGEGGLTDRYIQSELLTPEGAGFLAWLLIRKEQPDVKLEAIQPHVTADNTVEVLAKLMAASGLEAISAGKAGAGGSVRGKGSPASTFTGKPSKNPKAS